MQNLDQVPQLNMSNSKKNNTSLVIVVVGLFLVAGVGAYALLGMDSTAQKTEMSVVETKPSATTTTELEAGQGERRMENSQMAAAFKDGQYQATGMYKSPAGPEEIEVVLTLEDEVIIDANVKGLAQNPTSINFQGKFTNGYKQQVIGKKISEVSLDVVAGSSLTPKGFNDALQKIKGQAQQ